MTFNIRIRSLKGKAGSKEKFSPNGKCMNTVHAFYSGLYWLLCLIAFLNNGASRGFSATAERLVVILYQLRGWDGL